MHEVGARRAGALESRPLVERSQELALIEDAIETVRGGTGALVVFEGGHGIGKTSLLSAARERAHERGLAVLHARAGEREREFAFGIVRQLLEPPLAAVGDEERDALLAGPAATA